MATSSISSLGIGSSGVLSQNVIDQLRASDENSIIKPITNKITKNTNKANSLAELTTLVATLKSDTSALSDATTYLNNTATSSSKSVSVDAKSGVPSQDFSINVTQVAKQDIYKSNLFEGKDSTFTTSDDTININIDGKDYDIDVNSSTTISSLQSKIYDATDGKVTASILNVGEAKPYQLTLKSTDTGASNAITLTSKGGGTAISDLGLDDVDNHIQTAANAKFTYNNIDITRPTNKVDDLIVGVTLDFNDIGVSNISISQDSSAVSDAVNSFVDDYNSLINNLDETTGYDPATKTAGIFQGTGELRDLKSIINNQLLSIDGKGRNISDYGVSLNSAGLLEVDQNTLDDKLNSNLSDVQDFFQGSTKLNDGVLTTKKGYFTDFNDLLSNYTNPTSGILTQLDTEFGTQAKSLKSEQQKAIHSLDSKYDAMTSKFIAYDSMISQMNSSFQSLNMQIQALTNSSKK